MMNMSIKNVPDDIVERLRARARRNHRSMQGEMLAILEEAVEPEKLTVREAVRRIKALGIRTAGDSTAMISADRAAR